MRMKKVFAVVFAALMLAVMAAGCGGPETPPVRPAPPSVTPGAQTPAQTPQTPQTQPDDSPAPPESATFMFTDSAGREVELPRNIERVAPSGPLAQIVLFTLVPDKLVGLSGGFAEEQMEFMDATMADLPILGGYSQGTLNLESLMVADPQIFIDIGEVQNDSAGDMDGIQEATGITAIFVRMDSLESMITAYETLGMLLGAEDQARKLGDYVSETIRDVVDVASSIPEGERAKVFYGQNDGLTAVVDQTVHSDVIDFVSAINVAQVEANIRGGAAEISMEQLIMWAPDVVLFAPESIYDDVGTRPEWSAIGAISDGKYYEIPLGPYNWMGRPPSVNRVIGVRWLANLLYPDMFPLDMAEEAREFYRLFYHWELTDAQIDDLLAKSTHK